MRTATAPHRSTRSAARLGLLAGAVVLPLTVAACGGTPAPVTPSASSSASSASSTTMSAASATTDTPSTGSSTTTCAFQGATTAPGDTALASLTVSGVRVSAQPCADRVVVEMSGTSSTKPGYQVRYVPQVVQDASGEPVKLRGRAFLSVSVGAPAYNPAGQPTYIPANRSEIADVKGYASIQQVAFAGSFEGMTSFGIGVSDKLPFSVQVTAEDGKTQLVLDIAHPS